MPDDPKTPNEPKKPDAPKTGEPEAKPMEMIDIDILGMELDQNLPHWLHPAQKLSHLHNEDRKKRQIERTKAAMKKPK